MSERVESVDLDMDCPGFLCGYAVEHLVADPVRGFVEVCGFCLEARDLGEDCIADVRVRDGLVEVIVLDEHRWAAAVAVRS